ncbi:MAG: hypothetical protein GX925_04120, partial [Clostridiales bacterium]|nr:hypothetical protein [Clostridiales bacterium]
KNVILSEAKDLKWPKNEILRYTQNDKKRGKCFFTQSAISGVFLKMQQEPSPAHLYILISISFIKTFDGKCYQPIY